MIVLDASVVVEMLLGTPAGRRAADRFLRREVSLCAPHLLDVEVAHALRRLAVAGQIRSVRAREAVDDLAALQIVRYPHVELLPRIWELRHGLTAYDASYVALAEALGARLVTRDAALAAVRVRAAVEVLQD